MFNYNTPQGLFSENSLNSYLRDRKNEIKESIGNMGTNEFYANSHEDITNNYEEKYSIYPLILHTEKMIANASEITKDAFDPFNDRRSAKYIELDVTIPYSGDSVLWKLCPGSYTHPVNSWQANITDPDPDADPLGYLIIHFEYEQNQANSDQINKDIDKKISLIQSNINSQNSEIESYNKELNALIVSCVKERGTVLKQRDTILSGLKIPIKPKFGVPDIKPIQVRKRIVPLKLKMINPNFTPEPGISEEIFQDILAILRFMGRTFEETAKTFNKLGEEDLRNIFLSALNGYFEGEAGGEIFRNDGKTDICIKEKEKAAFVAECKIWHGQKSVSSALDQLLGYLTWRDCKASIIIFNKDIKSFSNILAELPEAIRQHKLFINESKIQHDGEWKFIVKHVNDENRNIILHIFIFNLYFKKELLELKPGVV